MQLHKWNNEKGYTVLEMSIGMALLTLGVLVVSYFFVEAGKGTAYAMNNETRSGIVKQISSLLTSAMSSPSIYTFDPANTLVGGSTFSLAGNWTIRDPNTGADALKVTADIFSFTIDGQSLRQDSHMLEAYKIETDAAAGTVTKRALYGLISRCIDSRATAEPTVLADILALRKPVWVGNRVHCCTDLTTCPGPESESLAFWPATFVFKRQDTLKPFPNGRERDVIPGAAFMVTFNRADKPDQATFHTFILENRCKLSPVGIGFETSTLGIPFSRSPNRCTRGEIGNLPTAYYETDFRYTLIQQTNRPLATDITGSGFMKL